MRHKAGAHRAGTTQSPETVPALGRCPSICVSPPHSPPANLLLGPNLICLGETKCELSHRGGPCLFTDRGWSGGGGALAQLSGQSRNSTPGFFKQWQQGLHRALGGQVQKLHLLCDRFQKALCNCNRTDDQGT